MAAPSRLKSIKIQGYRPFKDFSAQLGPLEVIVGANGSGKSSLFEFLRFLRDGMSDEIPPGIVPRYIGQRVFHSPGTERFSWDAETDFSGDDSIRYQGEIMGPEGRPRVISESVKTDLGRTLMEIRGENRLYIQNSNAVSQERPLGSTNRLALSTAMYQVVETLSSLREYISSWQFYNSFSVDRDKIRRSVLIEQAPILDENAGNLSSVLHYLMTEHESVFDELQQHLRSTIPGFKKLTVKAYGAPGNIMAFWQEDRVEGDLTLADLSDGILHLICWMVLCLQPNLPSLICIDEPAQGLHPRTLPFLAGLLKKVSNRTQVLLATHSSYFLTQFDISRIAVMRKENGEAKFLKPKDSKALMGILEDFGPEEIEAMHLSDELEILA